MKNKNVMPPTYLLIAILVMVALHFLFPLVIIIPPLLNLVGFFPIVIGVMINLIADQAFHKSNTTVKPFEDSTVLITKGAFRISRNPMYLGFVLILFGIAILLRSLSPYVIALVFVILMDRMYIRVEEQMLKEKFGAEWEEYKKNTNRWL